MLQVGTSSYNEFGSDVYTVWFQYPPYLNTAQSFCSNASDFSCFQINVGDVIEAEISLVPNTTEQWNVSLIDVTTTTGFSTLLNLSDSAKSPSEYSAEWIDERPTGIFGPLSLAKFGVGDFGPSFTGTVGNWAGNSSDNKSIGVWVGAVKRYVLVDGSSILATESPLTPYNDSFIVNYGNLTVNRITIPSLIPSGVNVNLIANVLGGTSPVNLNYQWYDVGPDFYLRTPINSSGANTSILNANFTSNTIVVFFVTDNGISPNPIAYNYAYINVSTVPLMLNLTSNSITYGTSDIITLTPYSTADGANIIIGSNVVASGTNTISYNIFGSSPNTLSVGTYNVLGCDTTFNVCVSNVLVVSPENVIIKITNSQGSATANGMQQKIVFDPTNILFSGQVTSNLGNIRFYSNSAELYSWCESGCSSSASSSTFSIRLPFSIGAHSSTNINMTFLPANTGYDGFHAGEAPQLSGSYAAYDNGNSVFPMLYQDFNGTSCPSGWSCSGSGTNVGNGVTVLYSYGSHGIAETTASYGATPGNVLDIYGKYNQTIGTFCNVENSVFGYLYPSWQFTGWACDYSATLVDVIGSTFGTQRPTNSTYHIYSTYFPSSTTATFNYDYGNTETKTGSSGAAPIGIDNWQNNGGNFYMYWVRLRQYPPNGVMPSITFNSNVSSSTNTVAAPLPLCDGAYNNWLRAGVNDALDTVFMLWKRDFPGL